MGDIHCYSLQQIFENTKLKDYANLFVAPPGKNKVFFQKYLQ